MSIKELKIKTIDSYSIIFSGFLYLVLGILFLTQKETLIFAVKSLLNLTTILFIIIALFQLVGFSPLRNKRLSSISRLLGFLINIIMALILYLKPQIIISILHILFGFYAITSGVIRILIYFQYRRNGVKNRSFIILESIVLIALGIMIIIHPLASFLPITNIIGIFFVFYGISYIIDGVSEALPIDTKNSFKRRFRVSLPIFMLAFIPHSILMKINKAFETESLNEEDLVAFKENTPFDLEVLIHVGEKGISAFGHVDIYFDGKVMTYGSYDEDTYRLKGLISDGVLMQIDDKGKYIDFSQKHLGKTLFGFGLKLTEKQEYRVREKIEDIRKNLYKWEPKSKIDENLGIKPKEAYTDYASIVYKNLKADFYKFLKGPFKTYFVMNTNCVLLADSIVGQSGIDLVNVNGLISPGAYFEFFNKEFLRKNSFVISRTIYYKDKDIDNEFVEEVK